MRHASAAFQVLVKACCMCEGSRGMPHVMCCMLLADLTAGEDGLSTGARPAMAGLCQTWAFPHGHSHALVQDLSRQLLRTSLEQPDATLLPAGRLGQPDSTVTIPGRSRVKIAAQARS